MTLLLTITKPRRGDISLKKIKKHASQVGWISEAHPPLKITTVIVHGAKKSLRHSARSEAEMQNLLNNRQKGFSREPKRFCDCAQNDIMFQSGRVDKLFSAHPPPNNQTVILQGAKKELHHEHLKKNILKKFDIEFNDKYLFDWLE